jgi:hypothetical protein
MKHSYIEGMDMEKKMAKIEIYFGSRSKQGKG